MDPNGSNAPRPGASSLLSGLHHLPKIAPSWAIHGFYEANNPHPKKLKVTLVPVGILTPSFLAFNYIFQNDPTRHSYSATATWTSPFKTAGLLGQQCPSWKPSWLGGNRDWQLIQRNFKKASTLRQNHWDNHSKPFKNLTQVIQNHSPIIQAWLFQTKTFAQPQHPQNPNNLSNLQPGDPWLQYSWPSQRSSSGPNAASGHPTACNNKWKFPKIGVPLVTILFRFSQK